MVTAQALPSLVPNSAAGSTSSASVKAESPPRWLSISLFLFVFFFCLKCTGVQTYSGVIFEFPFPYELYFHDIYLGILIRSRWKIPEYFSWKRSMLEFKCNFKMALAPLWNRNAWFWVYFYFFHRFKGITSTFRQDSTIFFYFFALLIYS